MILVVGSINMDVCLKVGSIPRPGQTVMAGGLMTNPGGKGANQAVAAGKLGTGVTLLGCVGRDEYGGMLLASLSRYGVDTAYVRQDPAVPSSTAYICVADSGENCIVVNSSANACVSPEYLRGQEALFEKASYCILQLEIPAETVREAIRLCRKHSVKTVLNPSPLDGFELSLLEGIDVLLPNEEEAEALLKLDGRSGRLDETEIAAFLKKYRIGRMIVTLGAAGCVLYSEGKAPKRFPVKARRAVDTTGAGDTFLGAYVASLEQGRTEEEAIRYAGIASGITVTRPGAQQAMPDAEEVERDLAEEEQKT